jgi:hypothetical protein
MNARQKTARLAGLLYLVIVVGAPFSFVFVPSRIVVSGDPLATANNLQAFESLFRWGILGGVVVATAQSLLPLALYKLLHRVNRTCAVLMVVLCVASVPLILLGFVYELHALSLLTGAEHLGAFSTEQLYAKMYLALDSFDNALFLGAPFFALWLLPLGYLVYESGFIPRILGLLLMLGCFGYLVDFFGHLFFPSYPELGISMYFLALGVGEVLFCLWLLVKGVRTPQPSGAP